MGAHFCVSLLLKLEDLRPKPWEMAEKWRSVDYPNKGLKQDPRVSLGG